MLGLFIGLFAGMTGLIGLAGRSGSDPLAGTVQADQPESITKADSEANTVALAEAPSETGPDTPTPVQAKTIAPARESAEPAPSKAPAPDLEANLKITLPVAPEQTVKVFSNTVDAADLGNAYAGTAVSGRVETFDLQDDDIAGIEVLKGPAYGNVSVNPDNTLALVLSGTSKTHDISFDLQVTYTDGSVTQETVQIDVTEGPLMKGWGLGDIYMLETDDTGDVIVEHGENHRKVHVSGDKDALSLADIAALEGLNVEDIDKKFLTAHTEYGSTPETALAEDAGNLLWKAISGPSAGPQSNWLLMERGYEYSEMTEVLPNGTLGESELHPVYVGAYGTGADPVLSAHVTTMKSGNENIVVQGIEVTDGVRLLSGENIILDDITATDKILNIQNIDGFTLRNSTVLDVVKEETASGGDTWRPHLDRESGIFVTKSQGILIENTLFDHNGWSEGFDPDGSADAPQPPSMYSHNVYLQFSNNDVTFRDNIIMQGASAGAQVRSGGFIENNVFIDNNLQVMFGDGTQDDGNYTLFTGNVMTSGAHKEAELIGGLTMGVVNQGAMAALVDNIVAHLADPNNPAELDSKEIAHDAVNNKVAPVYDDTIVHNWVGYKNDPAQDANNINTEGLDHGVLNETTIQNFTAQLLGQKSATISDLADYLRAQADGRFDDVVDADLIVDFFQTGFGLQADLRIDADTLRFIPNELGDGIRWDNRLNWSIDDLPGTQNGDSVDLGGNWVHYSGTTTIDDLDFGDGGTLNVTQGYLQVDDHIATQQGGATLSIDKAGQFWTGGYTDKDLLTIDVDGGRFANTGLFTGTADMTVTDNAQVLLAANGGDYVMGADSRLEITGGDTRVGFDGDQGNTGVLLMDKGADLQFTADHTGTLGRIEEFFSGRYDDASDIQSGVNLGDATLHLDLSTLAGGASHSQTLIEVDELIGTFDALDVTGLGKDQDASVLINYTEDTVTLSLGTAGKGNGAVSLKTAGNAEDAQANADLWAALTNGHGIYPEDPPETIPAEGDDGFDL